MCCRTGFTAFAITASSATAIVPQKLARCRELLIGSAPAVYRRLSLPADYRDRFRGADGTDPARMSSLPYRHHGDDRLRRTAQGLPDGSGYIMTRYRRSNPTKPNCPPGRSGAVCAATAIGVPDHAPKRSDPGCDDGSGRPDCRGPRLQSRCSECSDDASAKDPAAFNAHSLGGTKSGLVQHVFRSPARIQAFDRLSRGEACAPRRQAKNAVRFGVFLSGWAGTYSPRCASGRRTPTRATVTHHRALSICTAVHCVAGTYVPIEPTHLSPGAAPRCCFAATTAMRPASASGP